MEDMNELYPFSLNNAFFVKIEFFRAPDLSEVQEFEAKVDLQVVTDRLPERLQLNLKLKSDESQAVKFHLELVGLFDLEEGFEEPSEESLYEFINQRALYIMWQYIIQMSRILSAQMGMNPVNWRMPKNFVLEASGRDKEEVSPDEQV